MKKILLLSSIFLFAVSSCDKETPETLNFNPQANGEDANSAVSGWFEVAPLPPVGRLNAVAFSIGNKAYAGMGATENFYAFDFWEYDPGADRWTKKADHPLRTTPPEAAFSIGSKGYVVNPYFPRHQLWEYDPSTNNWTRKADFPNLPMYIPQSYATFTIGNKGYVGISCGDYHIFEYDPANDRWTKKATFPGRNRRDLIGFSVGAKGYIGLGVGDRELADIWEYDPAADSWTRKADFAGGPRVQAVAFSIGDKGYVGTGLGADWHPINDQKSDLWEYDPANDTWTLLNLTGLPGRVDAVGFSIGKTGYIGTGGQYRSDFWKFTVD